MRFLPPLATQDRAFGAVLIVVLGIVQATVLAIAAFATRDAFAALHAGDVLSASTMAELAGSGAIAALCLYLSRRQSEALGQSYAVSLRRVLYEQIAGLPKSRHKERRTGALSLRFVGDLSAARLWFGRGLPDVLTAFVVLPGAVIILFALDSTLAGFGLIPLSLALVCMIASAWHLHRRHSQLRRRRANIAIAMIERIAIAPELDLMGRTDRELRALDKQGASLKRDAVSRRSRTAGLQGILQFGVALSGLAILWIAGQNGTAPATVAASLSVLALVALPLRDLGAAWDRYCAWRVAREKAQRLLSEPTVRRQSRRASGPVAVFARGLFEDGTVEFTAHAGEVATMRGPHAPTLARALAGLDSRDGIDIRFGETPGTPRIAYVGDDHVGLQGSLRRSATLSAPTRPKDREVADVLSAFGLGDLLETPRGLNRRIAENGRDLTPAQTLRLDLVRAVLGQSNVVVISSLRWHAEPAKDRLLAVLRQRRPVTVLMVEAPTHNNTWENSKAS